VQNSVFKRPSISSKSKISIGKYSSFWHLHRRTMLSANTKRWSSDISCVASVCRV